MDDLRNSNYHRAGNLINSAFIKKSKINTTRRYLSYADDDAEKKKLSTKLNKLVESHNNDIYEACHLLLLCLESTDKPLPEVDKNNPDAIYKYIKEMENTK